MEKKAKDLVYLDSGQYISLESLKYLYIAIGPLSLFPLIGGIVCNHMILIVATVLLNLLYFIVLFILNSKKIPQKFSLRFLINGITSFILSVLFVLMLFTVVISSHSDPLNFVLWFSIAYVSFIILYSVLIIMGVHKGFFEKLKKKSQSSRFMAISYFAGILIPCSGTMGMYLSKMVRNAEDTSLKSVLGIFSICLVIFLSALGYINFIQYYYCIKYSIHCDENGNMTSPLLAPEPKKKKRSKKKPSAISKIIAIIFTVVISVFVLLLVIGFIRGS